MPGAWILARAYLEESNGQTHAHDSAEPLPRCQYTSTRYYRGSIGEHGEDSSIRHIVRATSLRMYQAGRERSGLHALQCPMAAAVLAQPPVPVAIPSLYWYVTER